jgi:hypothetical protein
VGAFTYLDISATPVQGYSCSNKAWVVQGGSGGSGSGTVVSGLALSPAYYTSSGTVVGGVTPFNGLGFWSTSAAPRAATSSDVTALLATDTVNNSAYGFATGSGGDATCPTPVSGKDYLCMKAGVMSYTHNGAAYVAFVNGGAAIANATTTVGVTAIAANTCATAVTVTMTGVATTSTFAFSPNADISGVTGWGSTGGLTVDAWPTANTLNYKVCNQTNASITPSASVTFNVSAR